MIEVLASLAIAFFGSRFIARLLLRRQDGLTTGTIVVLSVIGSIGSLVLLYVGSRAHWQIEGVVPAIAETSQWDVFLLGGAALLSFFCAFRLCVQNLALCNESESEVFE
ncbi:hypothetical protein CD351_11335 [Erythrobacter sp. KY5]|uniref:hypothetical protein n=1 Tax=Erythrobacter sp. KY5 TaxID=2011159 RepID=UPI000DBF2A77|nr:hypothetical protein [Erythrobacter sp. KY5]AWW75020.1 hypothetical protein CD351_11335 [Erythrobacter sp. KY5]